MNKTIARIIIAAFILSAMLIFANKADAALSCNVTESCDEQGLNLIGNVDVRVVRNGMRKVISHKVVVRLYMVYDQGLYSPFLKDIACGIPLSLLGTRECSGCARASLLKKRKS